MSNEHNNAPAVPQGWQPIDSAPVSDAISNPQWVLIYCVPANRGNPHQYHARQFLAALTSGLAGRHYWKLGRLSVDVLDERIYTPTYWTPVPPNPGLVNPSTDPVKEVDLVARGTKWDEADALIRECASHAGIEWSDPNPLAVNLMHRIANKAHQDGFRLALSRFTTPTQEVGLTDEEICECFGIDGADDWVFKGARAIIAALRAKGASDA